jgi:hypothetical protein
LFHPDRRSRCLKLHITIVPRMLGQNSASSDQNDHIPPSPSVGHGFNVPDLLQAPFPTTSPFPSSSPNQPNQTQHPAPLYSAFRHSLPTNYGTGRSIDKRPSPHEIDSRGSALTGPLDSYVVSHFAPPFLLSLDISILY